MEHGIEVRRGERFEDIADDAVADGAGGPGLLGQRGVLHGEQQSADVRIGVQEPTLLKQHVGSSCSAIVRRCPVAPAPPAGVTDGDGFDWILPGGIAALDDRSTAFVAACPTTTSGLLAGVLRNLPSATHQRCVGHPARVLTSDRRVRGQLSSSASTSPMILVPGAPAAARRPRPPRPRTRSRRPTAPRRRARGATPRPRPPDRRASRRPRPPCGHPTRHLVHEVHRLLAPGRGRHGRLAIRMLACPTRRAPRRNRLHRDG